MRFVYTGVVLFVLGFLAVLSDEKGAGFLLFGATCACWLKAEA